MKLKDKLKLSIQARLSVASGLSVISFIVIALILLVAFMQVRRDIGRAVSTQLQQTIDSSELAREMGAFLARLRQLNATFYGNDEYLQREGIKLLDLIGQQHEHGHDEKLLANQFLPLRQKLSDYLEQCKTVNELLLWRSWEDEGLDEVFIIIEEILAKLMIDAALEGRSVEYYEQLTLQIASYRVSLLGIMQRNIREQPQTLFNASFFDLPPNSENISNLSLRLRTLAAAEAPLNRFGRHLIDQLKYYQHLMTRYQQEMIHLGRRTAELNQLAEAVLNQLEVIDQQHAKAADRARQQIDKNIFNTGAIVLGLLIVLALMLSLIHLNLFAYHIKRPMDKIRNRLLRFRQGDYSSPISLNRTDEWGQIEEVFDGMVADLVESWSALQESERRYRNIFDNASEGIYQSSVEGAFLNINPAMHKIFGIDEDQPLETFNNLRERIYADPADRDRLISRLFKEETVNNFETLMRRNDGEIFRASINSHLVRDKDDLILFIEGTVEDISKRWQAEEALRSLKEFLHDIVDAMPSIMIGVNSALEITLWNRQTVEISGIEEKMAIGRPLPEILTFVEPTYQPVVEETLTSGNVLRLQKIAGLVKTQERFFDLLVYPLRGADSYGAMIHMDDITEKVQIEEVMVQSEKMLSIGNLAAGMAHEINNPLASVLQNVQVMGQRLSPALEKNRKTAAEIGISIEQVAEYAQQRGFDQMMKSIAASGQRAARIIENMLNFSRKSSSSFLPCSLPDLVEKTIELAASDYDMKHHFDFRTISLIRDYQPVPDVPCESSQIQQVVLNLLKNAALAIGHKVAHPEIRIRIFPLDEQVCLQIEDNGAGMDEATSKRIFEPFFTTQEVGLGTGLGLSVSYFLITENHQGTLTVKSVPGQGSCFSVQLPLKRN